MVTFDEAYEAAAARYSEEAWWNLHPTVVILAILEAVRRLDAEAATLRAKDRLSSGAVIPAWTRRTTDDAE
jgi:hypothetical protein